MRVFICYDREDFNNAKRLYDDLISFGIKPWMDKVDLLPGQNWKLIISKAIQESRYFIALLSSNSLNKKGFFHSFIFVKRHSIPIIVRSGHSLIKLWNLNKK